MKNTILSLFFLLTLSSSLYSDLAKPLSEEEKSESSKIILDAEVASISLLERKVLKGQVTPSILKTSYVATLSDVNVIRMDEQMSSSGRKVLNYKFIFSRINDSRYMGEVAPEIEVGTKYRFFLDEAHLCWDGDFIFFVHSENDVGSN